MSNRIHAFEYLESPQPLMPVTAIAGSDRFLKQLALKALIHNSVEGDDSDHQVTEVAGKTGQWRDVLDELSCRSLFGGGGRVVIVAEADDFVSRYRPQLEDYCNQPTPGGHLILEVIRFPATTRLYQALDKQGLIIDCALPQRPKSKSVDEARVRKWLQLRAQQIHDITLPDLSAVELMNLVGPELGLLEQEVSKLALFVESGDAVDIELVRRIVGGWRTKTSWEMLDAAASGNSSLALALLHRLLQSGEHPLALFGSIAWYMRRFARAAQIVAQAEQDGRRAPLREALEQAGFPRWPPQAIGTAEQQLRQIGRFRAIQLFRWLLRTDLSLKGSHSSPDRARWALEKLILQLARQENQRRR